MVFGDRAIYIYPGSSGFLLLSSKRVSYGQSIIYDTFSNYSSDSKNKKKFGDKLWNKSLGLFKSDKGRIRNRALLLK